MYSNSYQKYLEQKEKNKSGQNLSDTLQQFRERAIADYSAQQQLEEESVARGRAMVEAQKARDTINQAASNTAATYDFAHGQLPSISNAQAFQNAQRQTSLDDSLNQIMGNNVLTDAGRVSKAQEAFGSLLSAPTVSSTPTAREVANAYRQSYANINTPIQKAAQAVEAYKEEREKVWEEARKKQAEDIGSQRNVGALTRELNRKKQENSQKAWELSLEMQNAGSVERVNEIQKQIDALNESTNRTQQQLDNAIAAQDYLLRYNDNFAENARYDENIIGGLPKTTGGNNTAALYQFINGRYQAKEGDPALDMWRIYTYLDDNERGTFNYLLKTEGAERADEYLQRLQPELEARNAQAISKRAYEYGRTNPWKAAAGTVAFSPLRTLGALGTAYDELVNGKVNENAWYNTQSQVLGSARSGALDTFGESVTNSGVVQGIANSRPVSYFAERVLDQSPKEVAENVGKVAKFLGSGTLSHLDSLWNGFLMQNISALQGGMNWGDAQKIYQLEKDNPGLISSINPEAADRAKKIVTGAEELTRAVMGAEVVSDAVREAKERGLSDEQAFELGMVAGAAEYITEKWSIGDLFESDWTKPTLTKMLTHGGGEFSEEIMSSLINEIADISVAGEKSQFRQDFNEYKKNGASDGKAFAHTLLDHALEAGKEGLSAFLTTGVSVGLTSVQQNIHNPQTIHNKVSSADRKSGGNVGATVDGMLADLINRPETEWASGLADIANQFRGTVKGNTINAVRDYIRETARNQADAFDNGAYTALADYLTPYKDQNGKKVDNRNAVWQLAEERNGTAKQTAQNTQTETAPSTESTTPSTAPSTLSTESTTAPSTESTTPQIQATNAENQAITAENQATTSQTAQNVPQTSENAPVAENAVETENNTVAENEAQRGSVSATDDGRALLLRELNVSEEATDAEVAQELLKRVDSRKIWNRITGLRNTAANNQAEVLDRMRQSGQYTPEQIEAARQTAVSVGRELGNLTSEVGVQKAVNAANAALRKAGIKAKIVVDNVAKVDYNGRVNERGSYKDSDGTIHVSPYLDTNEAIMGVLAHEMFHKAADGSERAQLVDDILAARNAILNASQSGRYGISRVTRAVIGNNSMGDFVESYGDLLMKDFGLTEEGQTALQNKLNANPGMDTDTALKQLCDENEAAFWQMWNDNKNLGTAQNYMKEEVAAHFFEDLGSQRGEAIMRELMRNDRNLFERIIDAVRRYFHRNDPDYARNETYNRIMNAYERIAAEESGLDARKLKGTAAQKAESEKATTSELNSSELKEAVENHEPLSVKDEVRASRLLDSELYQEAFDKQFGKTKKKLALITPEDKALWARLKKVRSTVKQRLDEIAESANLPADVVGQTTFGNSSYGKTNENTTICPRTLSLDALADQVAEDLGRPLTVEESVYVAQEAFNFTQTPQCVYCYVAMDRFAKREVLLDYVEKRKRVYADLDKGLSVEQALENYKKLETSGGKKWSVSGEDSDKKARFDMWVRNYQQGKRGVILSDLASERALERSLADPELAEEVNDALAYAQSASWAKKKVGYAAYGGDILRWNKKAVDALNSMFGLRMYSFSDYSPAFILENMQMVTDAAVKKLKMLAYTKELDFVKIFAGTGMNINISVFSMNGRDQYGDFAEDAMQGAPWKEAQALRDKYPNVGITYVATNDEQVEWALDQPWIDVVIPFHMVKTGAKVAKIFGYQNYTGESHDTKIKGLEATQKEIFPNQHQNSKEKYFAALKEANLEPRFARWQNHPNYMKLVNETRRSAQDTPAVQPIFDLQAALDSINGMVERGGYAVPIGGSLEQQAKIANMMAENISAGVAKDLQIREGIILKDGKPITFNTLLGDMEEDDDSDYDRQSRMVSSEQDEKYMNAVESNNMDQVQRIVDEAARNAGYTIKVYHGTPLETISASRGRLQGEAYRNLQTDYADKLFPFVVFKDNGRLTGIYTATDKGIAENFSFNFSDTGTVYDLYAKSENPFRFDAHGNGWSNIPADSLNGLGITKTGKITLDDVAKAAKAQGYDAVIVDNVRETGSGDSDSPVTTDVIVFDSNQIKSAEPVTYDDNGDVIPVSERFNSKKADVRYSRLVTPEQDAEYMEAVESGDTEKQQRMVDDAAKEAGYTVRKWHQTNVPNIHVFDLGIGTHGGTDSETPYGVFTKSTNRDIGLGNVQMQLLLKAGKTFTINNREELRNKMPEAYKLLAQELEAVDAKYESLAQEAEDALFEAQDAYEEKHPDVEISIEDIVNNRTYDDPDCQKANERWKAVMAEWREEADKIRVRAKGVLTDYLKANNYDSMEIKLDRGSNGRSTDTFIVLSPEQVKSANPVSYDNDGNPIPLSERFNPENEDIRYSREVGNIAELDDDYDAYNRTVLLKEDTVDKFLDEYASKGNPNYAQAYVTRMRPQDFLNLTTTAYGANSEGHIRSQTDPMRGEELADYTRDMPIQLIIENGEVVGHEGRHRMVAMERNGINSVPVLVFDYTNKDNKTDVDAMTLAPQDLGEGRKYQKQTLHNLIPLSYTNRDRIVSEYGAQPTLERMQEKYNGKQTMRFSREMDNEYMDAVESGDEETAYRMIDEAAKAKGLTIFDDEYPTIQSLYEGVKNGELLIHARRLDLSEISDYQYGLDPTWGDTMQGTEAAGWYDEEGIDPPELIFASDGTTWSGDERNGIIFVRSDDFQQSNGDGTVNLPDGSTVPYEQSPVADYENPALREEPAGVESNDWYTNKVADVVAVMPFYAKSGDITYDDSGNVIPLSQRFNPESEDFRESRMLKSESDYEQALAEEREKRDFMTKQFVGKNSFGYAKALEKSKHDAIVKRYTDLFGEDIPADEINRVIREFERIMERPKRDANDTAEARMEEAWAYLEQQVRGWVERTSYENVLKETIGEEGTLEGLVALRTALRNPDDPGYYYIKPDMVTAAGSNDAWNETRRQLNGVKLKGFATQAEAEASGRKPISELWSKLTTDGGAYNGLFTADKNATDYEKLSDIASMYSLSKETESPYERRALGEYDNTGEVNAIVNDIMYAWEEAAEITRMGKAAQAADRRVAQADQRTADARRRGEERVQAEKEKAQARAERVKENTEKREAAMRERFEASYDRLRRSYDRKLDRASERYDKLQNRIKGKDIKRAQRMVLGRIAKDISALDKLQNHPSKDKNKYIPQRLLGTVAKVREAVQNFANRSGKTIDPARLTELQQSAMDETQNFMEGLGQGLKGVGSATEANARQDPNITDVFIRQADNLIQQLRDLRADIEENHPARPTVDENGKRITPTSEMIAEDNAREEAMYEYFNTVRQLLDMTLQAIRNEGKMILNGRTQDLREVSQLLASDLKQHRQKDVSLKPRNIGSETGNWFQTGTFGLMSADAALQRLGDNWHSFIARSVREGQNRQMKHQADFSDFMRETIGNYDITKGGFYGDYVTLERPDGTKFNVTRNELMSLYALWNRPAGRLHLENGGGTFINQNGQAFHDNNVVLTDELVKEYTDHLTDQEKEIVDKVVDYMSHEASKWGNDVSMYVYGYRLFNEDSYFPMEVADYANKRSFADPTMPGSGLNPGFTQALTRSKKPLAIRDFFDVVNDHIIGMSNYNAYGAAAHDLDRILNSSLKDGGKETSMIELLRKTYGNSAVNYLKGFVQKLAGTKHNDPSILDTLRTMGYLSGNLYKRAAVSWNLSTAAKQPLSIIRAANEIDPKYLIFRKPLSPSEYAAAKEKMESLSGIAKIKSLGYSDTGHAKSLQATYDDKYFSDSNFIRRGLGSNKAARGAFRFSDKFTEAGMYLAGKADEMTWVNIWDAVTHEVMDKYPNLSGDELDAKITERFNEVIGLTQVVDSILDSAPVLQEKVFSLAFPFMNEPVKSASNLILAASKFNQPGGKKKFAKAMGLQLLSAVLLEPLVTTLASMWRDEKDDIGNGFWDHFFEKMFGIKKDEDDDGKSDTDWKSITTSNAFAGIWSMPFITQLYDTYSNAVQDYDNTSIDKAAAVDLVKAFQNLHKYNGTSNEKSAKTQNRLWREFAESFASVLGVPAKTIRRQISGTARLLMNWAKADELKWEYNKLSYNLENSNARSQKGFYDILAHAYVTGNMETYEKFRKELNDIVTDNSTLVDVNTIIKNIEKRGGNVQPGDPLWNVEVQARFRLDTPVKGWHNENFLTGVYKQAESAGIKDDECKKVLYSLPDKYEYEDEEGDDIEMSPAEYDQFASDCGDLAYKLVSQLSSSSNSKAWSALTIDQQLYAIEKAYDYSKRKFRKDINPDLNISGMGKDLVAVYETAPMDTSKIVSTVMAMAKKYDKKKDRKKK